MNRRMNVKLLAEAERKHACAERTLAVWSAEHERVASLWDRDEATSADYRAAREGRDLAAQKMRVAEDWLMTVQGRVDVLLEAAR